MCNNIKGLFMKKNVLLLMTFALLGAINVMADDKPQIPNGDFETWTYNTSKLPKTLPNNWNSFETAGGSMATASMSLSGAGQVERSEVSRPNSKGSYSCRIWARSIMGKIAQGNLTSGRINAGHMTPTNINNYNYTDREGASSANGKKNEPCAMAFTGRPKSVKVWVKYVQAGAASKYGDHATAKFSAIIHSDADYIAYGLPSNDTEANKALVVAQAVKEIEANSGEWQELEIPFEYTENNVEPAYILVNASTNAYPGAGVANDELYIDDIEMVYEEEEPEEEEPKKEPIATKLFDKDKLYVNVSGNVVGPLSAAVNVKEYEDGTIDFSLNNFLLYSQKYDDETGEPIFDGEGNPVMDMDNPLGVGTINVKNIEAETDDDGVTRFSADKTIVISDGDDGIVADNFWLGPTLGDIPLEMTGMYDNDHLYVKIRIPLNEEMLVYVNLGQKSDIIDVIGEKVFDKDKLYVDVSGNVTGPLSAVVNVKEYADGTIDFSLNNFVLYSQKCDDETGEPVFDGEGNPVMDIDNPMGVGTIRVNDIDVTESDNIVSFTAEKTILIESGDNGIVIGDFWLGPQLGEIPLEMEGKYDDNHLYVKIHIPLNEEMIVDVELGKSEDVTAINVVRVETKAQKTGKIYDLNGREVKAMQSGQIYVVDGVKVAK